MTIEVLGRLGRKLPSKMNIHIQKLRVRLISHPYTKAYIKSTYRIYRFPFSARGGKGGV